jgi:hypothetical protein
VIEIEPQNQLLDQLKILRFDWLLVELSIRKSNEQSTKVFMRLNSVLYYIYTPMILDSTLSEWNSELVKDIRQFIIRSAFCVVH